MTAAELRRFVAESRRRSGVPTTIEDPGVLARLARILATGEAKR